MAAIFRPERLPTPVLVAVFLLTPAVTVSLALAACPATLLDCVPQWNDEIHYWNEAACFSSVGFAGGYFVADERPAAWSLSHFGPHGPAYPIIYGSLGRLLGWHLWSGPAFNILFLTLGCGAWLWCCRPDRPRLVSGIFLMATFWPCLVFLPSTLQEGLHCAIAFLLAGLAHARVNGDGRNRASLWGFLLAVGAASLVRITWVMILIPWACVALRRESWRIRLVVLVAIAAAIPGLTLVWRLACSPYPNFVATLLGEARESPALALSHLATRTSAMTSQFVSFYGATTLEIVERFEILGVMLLATWLALRSGSEDRRPYLFALLNLALPTAAVVCLYDVKDWRDCRTLAPHLLLSLLVLLSGSAHRWTLRIAAIQLAFAVPFVEQIIVNNRDRPMISSAENVSSYSKYEGGVGYDPAGTAWGNTILVPVRFQTCSLLGLPRGMGLSFILDEAELQPPLKSRYVLTPSLQFIPRLAEGIHLKPIGNGPFGRLYLNLDSLPDEKQDPALRPSPP
jgi:hypothetical protein